MCLVLAIGFLPASTVIAASPPKPILPAVPVDNDHDHDGIDDGIEQYLANLYAPVIYMAPQERNYPVSVDWWLANGEMGRTFAYQFNMADSMFLLRFHKLCDSGGFMFWSTDDVPMVIGNQMQLIGLTGPIMPWVYGAGCSPYGALSSIAPDPENSPGHSFVLEDVIDSVRVGDLNPNNWPTYVHVYPNKWGGITIQYWHAFAYNAFEGGLGGFFGNHGGDWDASIQVVLDLNLRPAEVWYSRHAEDKPGHWFAWDDIHVYQGTHPIVTIDAGGHAAFADMADRDWYWKFGTPLAVTMGDVAWVGDFANPDSLLFGTVWETWEGGRVFQRDLSSGGIPMACEHHISPNPGISGGIINVGEYNPGVKQESSLAANQGYSSILNGQVFVMYSGRWGSIGDTDLGTGPRGPVFQGWDGSTYTSWYHDASDQPAYWPVFHWREVPKTYYAIGKPSYSDGVYTHVTDKTTFQLRANPNAIADSFGPCNIYYRYFRVGDPAPGFSFYSGPFSISGSDGSYELDYAAVDALGNWNNLNALMLFKESKLMTETAVSSSANPSVFGKSVMLTATVGAVSLGSGTPTGSVEFFDGASSLGIGPLSSGIATLSISSLSVASHSITAKYSGDANFAASTSPAISEVVNQASTSTALTSSTNPSVFGQSVMLRAMVSFVPPGSGTPTGSVEFFDGSFSLGTSPLSSGIATLSTASLSVTSHSITAKYSGNVNFVTSTSPAINEAVNQSSTSTALTSSTNPSVFGQSVTFRAAVSVVSPGAGTPTGRVEFFDGASSLGTSPLSSGIVTLSISSLSVTSHSITAKYSGDANFAASTSPAISEVVNQSSTNTALASSSNPSVFGQSVMFRATVSVVSPGAGTPTGSVEFFDGASSLGTSPLNNGNATFSTSALSAGNHAVKAAYSGDTSFAGSSGSLTQKVWYNFSGFLAPLSKSTSNLGSTIPIKWQLKDYKGDFIDDLNTVRSLLVGPVGGQLAAPTANGGTVLRNDTASNQYIFNWKTTGLKTGNYTISLCLSDGTVQTTQVMLK
jgi:hypothetical protein